MVGKLDNYLRFHETSLNLRAKRQELLASNIANADTPNYKARDIDFKQTLQGALQGGQSMLPPSVPAVGMVKTSAAHLPGKSPMQVAQQGAIKAQYRTPVQGSVDGNTVDMDTERMQFTDNSLRYQAGLTLISGQIKSVLTAIQGQ